MANIQVELINHELRNHYRDLIENEFKCLQRKCFADVIMNKNEADKTNCHRSLPNLQEQMLELKTAILNEINDPKCTVAQAEFAKETAIKAHLATIFAFGEGKRPKSQSLKIVSDFFDFSRRSKLSRLSKAVIGGAVGLAVMLAIGMTIALTLFSGGMIPLVVAAGVAVMAGLASAIGTHRAAINPHEVRGKAFKDAMVNTIKADGFETYCGQRQDGIKRFAEPRNLDLVAPASGVVVGSSVGTLPRLKPPASAPAAPVAAPSSFAAPAGVRAPSFYAASGSTTFKPSSDPAFDKTKVKPSGFWRRMANGTIAF